MTCEQLPLSGVVSYLVCKVQLQELFSGAYLAGTMSDIIGVITKILQRSYSKTLLSLAIICFQLLFPVANRMLLIV